MSRRVCRWITHSKLMNDALLTGAGERGLDLQAKDTHDGAKGGRRLAVLVALGALP